jgi:virginiamycin B lyase
MMINVGATLPQDEIEPVIQYLAQHFPARPKPDAVVIPGSVQVAIQEWVVPTPGSRPHDPLATPDGAIWYTGQFANVLGRLDPQTGQITEYRLKTPHAGPQAWLRQRWQHLVHGQLQKSYRQARPENRTGD